MTLALTHLRLTTANSHAFCHTKCDRWTRVEVFAPQVTCTTCLAKAAEFHEKATAAIAARQSLLEAPLQVKPRGGKPTTKISAKKLKEARYKAEHFGASAVANDEGMDAYREDLALAYGHKDWDSLPRDLRSDASKHYLHGRRVEKAGGSL